MENRKNKKSRCFSMLLGVVFVLLLGAYMALLVHLTLQDMDRVENPYVPQVEDGVWNLTAQELTVSANELGNYVLYTNSTKIQIAAEARNAEGKIGLTRVEVPGEWLMENVVNAENSTVTFTCLSAADRYIVSCEGLDGVLVTASDGVEANFWESFQKVHLDFWKHIAYWLRN